MLKLILIYFEEYLNLHSFYCFCNRKLSLCLSTCHKDALGVEIQKLHVFLTWHYVRVSVFHYDRTTASFPKDAPVFVCMTDISACNIAAHSSRGRVCCTKWKNLEAVLNKMTCSIEQHTFLVITCYQTASVIQGLQ